MAVPSRPMRPFFRNLALWLLILLILLLVFQLFPGTQPARQMVTYSDFLEAVDEGRVGEVTLQGREIFGLYTDRSAFKTFSPNDPELVKILREAGVSIVAKPEKESPWYMTILISWFPMLLLIGVWIFFMRQMQGGGGKAMSFGKSRARLLNQDERKVSFADVAGIDEAKDEVEEIIEFLKNPKKFTKLGGRIPKGVLLMGPPGTGKTLLAKAIAGEAGVPFFSISGSDFVEMFVGVGASRVRDLFIQGKKNAPCIIFIDEIDAVGRHRGAGLGGGHDEREQTLNQLLVEMDGFESTEGVILIAATNRPDVLDPALLRPGRFDRQIVIPRPDVKGREGILRVHVKDVPLAADVDLSILARGTPGFSGADLENLVNEAALAAARVGKERVSMDDFEMAKDKVLMGSERRSLVLSEEERRNTAYHEAGHALVAMLLPQADPIYKVSIIPRGRALGVTQQLPIDERHTYTREYLLDRIAVFLGGRAAEEIFLGHLTTGAGDDIEKATEIARRMVCKWGMSERLGPLTFGKEDEQIFLGKEIATHKDYSERTAEQIDEEVTSIVASNLERAKKLLLDNRSTMAQLAETLLVKEVLVAEEIQQIVGDGSGTPAAEPAAQPPLAAGSDPAAPAAGRDLDSRQTDLGF
ncbi:MAG: ATP-dependent zinc metalloprotease FtsH [Deferrisomatales bacterium]